MNPLFADEPLVLDDPYMSRMSEEEFFNFCQQHRKWRIERNAQHEILIMAPTFTITGRRNARLLAQLGAWWNEYPEAGEIFDSNAGFTLPNGAVRAPDASWVSTQRWNALMPEQQEKFATLCPEFVVELRSKTDSLKVTERDTPRVHALRGEHVEAIAQRSDVARFHFLDETGLRLDYTRQYGRALGGQRVGQPVPLKRGRSLTLIGVLSVRGLHGVQVLKGALTHRSFALYVSRILGPRLRSGDVLVLDNLRVHHLTGLREWVAARGVEVLFLPPYSPDFTPVEQAWSKLKTALRHVQARTQLALEEALQTALPWIKQMDARHWFNHCGYHVHRS